MWPAFLRTSEMGVSLYTIKYGRSENIVMARYKTKQKGRGRAYFQFL
jgi:hypothetical protein